MNQSDTVPSTLPTETKAQRFSWQIMAWFATCIAICYAPVIVDLVQQWMTDDDLAHAPFAPFVAAYIVWHKRDELKSIPATCSNWGLSAVVFAAILTLVGTMLESKFLPRSALLLSVMGLVLYLRGVNTVRKVGFALLMLLFMIPLPWYFYKQLTFQLQLLASRMAEGSLDLLGYTVLREGNIIELVGRKLSVVEACSGIRSLYSLLFLTLTYSYFMEPKNWMRLLLILWTLLAAILANTARIVASATVGSLNPELAEGIYHAVTGWTITLVSFAFVIIFHRFVRSIYRSMRPRHAH
ncbi:MAG: exosortase/archaeosortase family protein [Bryobacteraceae bacterium]